MNDQNGNPRKGWLVLASEPFFVVEGGQSAIWGPADLYNRHGATSKATIKVSASVFRRFKSGRFLEGWQ
jgi:hypothetical protein